MNTGVLQKTGTLPAAKLWEAKRWYCVSPVFQRASAPVLGILQLCTHITADRV